MKYQCSSFSDSPYFAKLIQDKKDGENRILCFIRQTFVLATPEELVRQSFLAYVLENSLLFQTEKILIEVEQGDLDIAVFLAPIDKDFSPRTPPILIVETKRKDIKKLDTIENEKQIQSYLQRRNGQAGILFNCDSIFYYQSQTGFFQKKQLDSIDEVQEILRSQKQIVLNRLEKQKVLFEKAKNGDFDSFKALCMLYGKTSTIKFAYDEDGNKKTVLCFLIKFKDKKIFFRLRGLYTRNKQQLMEDQFSYLISISYGLAW